MPNRILRDGFLYSQAVNSVSEGAEVVFTRLLLVADDFGLVEIDPWTVKAKCLPGRTVDTTEVARRLGELIDAELLLPYEVAGRRLAAIARWDQRRNAKYPKFPLPPWGTEHVRGGYVDPRVATVAPPQSHSGTTVVPQPRNEERGVKPTPPSQGRVVTTVVRGGR